MIINNNYFDNILSDIEKNDYFYENLKNFISTNDSMNMEQCANKLYQKMNGKINLHSDFDEIFVQVYDKDLFSENMVCIQVLMLLYDKLNVLNKMDNETIEEFIYTINSNDGNGYITDRTSTERKNIFQTNQKIILQFMEKYNFFNEYDNEIDNENDDDE